MDVPVYLQVFSSSQQGNETGTYKSQHQPRQHYYAYCCLAQMYEEIAQLLVADMLMRKVFGLLAAHPNHLLPSFAWV